MNIIAISNHIGAAGSSVVKDFIMQVDTTIAGDLPDNQFLLRTHGNDVSQGNNFNVKTSDGQEFNNITAPTLTITFPSPGVYTLRISGKFSGTKYDYVTEGNKIIDILNWGDWEELQWARAGQSFRDCRSLTTFSAKDAPYLGGLDSQGIANMFYNCTNLNADFSKWDVSPISNFGGLFARCSNFNNDSICNWNMSSATSLYGMFEYASVFNQDLSAWNTSNVSDMRVMLFFASQFNGNVSTWDTSSLSGSLFRTFSRSAFNGDLSNWDVSGVTDLNNTFAYSSFNNNSISNWAVGSVTNMRSLFAFTPFNQDISGWDVSSVTDVYTMFNGQFNQPIGAWNLTSCTNLEWMFYGAYAFEQDLSAWDVSGVTKMTATFSNMGAAERSLNIGGWNTSSVENMESLLSGTRITDDLSGWDVSSCTNFQTLTPYGKIYFDLSLWAVQGPVNLNNMIRDTYTDQSIVDQWNFKDWDISQCISLGTQFALAETLTTNNYDQTLISWAAQAPVNALTAHFGGSKYSLSGAAEAARNTLINTYGWTIIDGGGIAAPFTFTVQTDNAGTSAADQFTIPITSATPYDIQTSDGQSITGATGATTLTFPSAGTYTVSITDSCEGWRFNNGGDKFKILDISNWGVFKNTVTNAFLGAVNMTCSATYASVNPPTTMNSIFSGCNLFNGTVQNWDVSGVSDFFGCFSGALIFNQPLDLWDTSSAVTFKYMFNACSLFNQPINSWNTNSIVGNGYSNMFQNAISFNQPLDTWNLSGATDINSMFTGASSFNQDLSLWNTSSVNNMAAVFQNATAMTHSVSGWNVSSVTRLESAFNNADLMNADLSLWNTANVTNMQGTFKSIPWNPNISGWNTGNVTDMSFMFYGNTANITDNYSSWDTSKVITLESFGNASNFNADISGWNTISLTNLRSFMYGNTTFSGTLSSWNTSNVTTMVFNPFYQTFAYDDDLGGWDVSKVSIINSFFKRPGFSTSNYNSLLVGWEASLQAAYPGGAGYPYTISVSFDTSKYTLGSAAETARTSLINTYGWTITDGGGI